MKPISFGCTDTLPMSSEEIAKQILDLSKWPEFTGYALLPGIRSAEFEVRTPEIVGTRIKVTNTDGSRHVEEIVEWRPSSRIQLIMSDFTPPLARLANSFVETWTFETVGPNTRVNRSFDLCPKSALACPLLWLISLLLRRAIVVHLRQLRERRGD